MGAHFSIPSASLSTFDTLSASFSGCPCTTASSSRPSAPSPATPAVSRSSGAWAEGGGGGWWRRGGRRGCGRVLGGAGRWKGGAGGGGGPGVAGAGRPWRRWGGSDPGARGFLANLKHHGVRVEC
ncbi:hypothetical protein ZWY2020_008821 [Hordeum vulgare]|nr:hypothetical protein ZWY2020_008821 [Hordeum vulgare]